MRRSITCLAVLGAAALVFVGTAAATPVVTLKGEAVPIPGFPHTGNILGAGADVEGEITIKGTEYGGYPPPVTGITLSLPTGTRLFPTGFPTCPTKVILTEHEPAKCPKGSSAGPTGRAYGFVVFGGERVPEQVSIQPFFAPGGGINFYVEGHTPASIEVTSTGRFTAFGGGGGYGPKAVIQVPLVETVPGAPDASVEKIIGKLGAARKVVKGKGKHKKTETIYYGRVPKKCPKGGFPAKVEVTFAALGGLPVQTASATFKAPCPRK